jgi:hypothetical protein
MTCLILVFLLGVWYVILFATRYPERTVRDVYPFFHRVDGEILVGSFHPDPEEEFRASHTGIEFKKFQSKRIHLALHLCRDITANCGLLIGWANFERHVNWSVLPEELKEGLRGFQVAALHSRTAAVAVRCRLRLQLIRMTMMPWLSVPSFNSLVEHSNTLIEFYHSTETLAEAISMGYGEDIHQNMLAVLGMVGLEFEAQEG